MSLEFLRTPFEKANYLATLLSSHASGGNADTAEYSALRHELLSISDVESLMPAFVRTNRDLTSFWHFIQPKFKSYKERRTFISEQFTPLLDYLEFGQKLAPPHSPKPTVSFVTPPKFYGGGDISEPVVRNKRKVFIVHGRDNEAKQEVARFLSALGLEPIILHEQASSGMTIIEKIERYANDADFALILYTPCDHGRGVHETKVAARSRARQNVVFEHGYLMAKLGRENVCALVKGDIETPNDISGVVYVQLDGFGGWKNDVMKELTACGYAIKNVL
ncbi:nucleotide-binding protein [Duganella sp. S19_KUP01_CR8]|uniref:nucleotide-binding protein n=1 Tax=Duganella sp. S19_KUP01_CR8 TaxID=3025502 RepID=UPI002FCDDAB6